ncbi:MAG: NUDIX hydrolase [Elusimicrobiota bacterium]
MPRTDKTSEHSAGGVILEDGRVLLILMLNLTGSKVWTFPKGHIEPGETPEAAALREVAEETGFDCAITRDLCKAVYSFERQGRHVDKDVLWYTMRRLGGDGVVKTPDEIFDIKWCTPDEAKNYLSYPSDLKMLELLKE